MKLKKMLRRMVLAVGVCSILAIEANAASSTAYLHADDNFVNTGSIQLTGESGASKAILFNGEVYSYSEKKATFGVYVLTDKAEWKFCGPSYTCAIGDAFGDMKRFGNGNYAYLKIVAGNDMFGLWNKNAIARGTVTQ